MPQLFDTTPALFERVFFVWWNSLNIESNFRYSRVVLFYYGNMRHVWACAGWRDQRGIVVDWEIK
jgi:hypothetical protein